MSKRIKKSIAIMFGVWFAFMGIVSILAIIANTNGRFDSPTKEEYDYLVSYVNEIKDNLFKDESICKKFYEDKMQIIKLEITEGNIETTAEISSEGISIITQKEKCIVDVKYDIIKEYTFLDETKDTDGIVVTRKHLIKDEEIIAKSSLIILTIVGTIFIFVPGIAEICSQMKEEKNKKK